MCNPPGGGVSAEWYNGAYKPLMMVLRQESIFNRGQFLCTPMHMPTLSVYHTTLRMMPREPLAYI